MWVTVPGRHTHGGETGGVVTETTGGQITDVVGNKREVIVRIAGVGVTGVETNTLWRWNMERDWCITITEAIAVNMVATVIMTVWRTRNVAVVLTRNMVSASVFPLNMFLSAATMS